MRPPRLRLRAPRPRAGPRLASLGAV